MKQTLYNGNLPDSFFHVGAKPYEALSFKPEEDTVFTRQLFEMEAERNDILLISDDGNVRLAGIFPKAGEDAFFGFWETENDLELNREAFAKLEAEARKRGFKQLIGPMN